MIRIASMLALLVAAAARVAGAADFNGDGFADLAVYTSEEETGLAASIGAVHVLYGVTGSGLSVVGNQFFVAPTASGVVAGPDFGIRFAAGDFDGDGFDDLAVASQQASVHGVANAGVVYEFRGSAGGLTFRRVIHQDKSGIKDHCEKDDAFGRALAAGDFDGDGKDDLAIGADERVDGKSQAGLVQVIYGSHDGLTTRDEIWDQNRDGVKDKAEASDHFGSTLAAGDLNGDGFADLAIRIAGEFRKHCDQNITGAVAVLYGDDDGLTASGDRIFDAKNVDDATNEVDTAFGFSLGIGDFDGDGDGDLAIGAPFLGADFQSLNGALYVVPTVGGKLDLASASSFVSPVTSAELGSSLTVGDFDGDDKDDVAVGAPLHPLGMSNGAGIVFEFHGSAQGLVVNSPILWFLGKGQVPGTPGAFELFGHGVAAADFDNDGIDDLAVGVSGETVGATAVAGAVVAIYGFGGLGLLDTGSQEFTQNSLGGGQVSGEAERFGDNVGS